MIRGPNVKTNFLENFVESWIFMYMMDSNQITPEMVYKFIDTLMFLQIFLITPVHVCQLQLFV